MSHPLPGFFFSLFSTIGYAAALIVLFFRKHIPAYFTRKKTAMKIKYLCKYKVKEASMNCIFFPFFFSHHSSFNEFPAEVMGHMQYPFIFLFSFQLHDFFFFCHCCCLGFLWVFLYTKLSCATSFSDKVFACTQTQELCLIINIR